jgi:hypothetical protein
MKALSWLSTYLLAAVAGTATVAIVAGPPGPRDTTASDPRPVAVALAGTPADLCARVAQAAEFRGDALVIAVAVALAESGCNPSAYHVNNTAPGLNPALSAGAAMRACPASVDRGLYQINSCAHPDVTNDCAYDAQCNADVAYDLSVRGTDFSPWVVFQTGGFRSRLDEARAAVDRLDINRQPVCRPVTGDWDGSATDTMGLACVPGSGLEMQWSLINTNSGGSPQIAGQYGSHRCVPVTGDWDGDGDTTIGVACRGSANQIVWSLSNGFAGSPSYQFEYGSAACWPVTGDWNGDRRTSVGVACRTRRSIEITWSLINSLGGGSPSYPPFGYGSTACRPVTGDWDGNGATTVGVACSRSGEIQWSLINSLSGGSPSYPTFGFGNANGCWPVTGDWNGNRSTTVGIACAGTELTWSLMNIHSGGSPQVRTGFGTGRSYESDAGWPGPDWPRWPNPF